MNAEIEHRKKILVAIASYGTANDYYLRQVIAEYHSMPFDVDIVVLSDISKEVPGGAELVVGLPAKDPWSLPFTHKKIFAQRLTKYDLFIYSEDDILIKEGNVRAFLQVSSVLPEGEILGFLRSEVGENGERHYPDVHGHFHWDPRSVRLRGELTLAYFTNEHAGCYMLTRQQLKRAIDSGGFLVGPHRGKHDLLCTAATDPYMQCGFKKMICISHLEDFLVHHLPNKYAGKIGIRESEFVRQIEALFTIGWNGDAPSSLFQTETKLLGARYSKDYYEPVRPEIVSLVPSGVQSALSVGCGWGATEAWLANKGLRVVGVPLDAVIPGGATASGVEMIQGDFKTARQKLAGQQFNCLLILNVLHLVEDPIDLLSTFVDILSTDSKVIVIVPNLTNAPVILRRVRSGESFNDWKSYEKTGVHFTSRAIVSRWFRSAGLKIEKVSHVMSPRAQKAARLTLGLANPLLASEFIAVARRDRVLSLDRRSDRCDTNPHALLNLDSECVRR